MAKAKTTTKKSSTKKETTKKAASKKTATKKSTAKKTTAIKTGPKTPLTDEVIAAKAFEIWESEGRPEGRAEAHWSMAIDALSR